MAGHGGTGTERFRISADDLHVRSDLRDRDFDSTDDLPSREQVVGQSRALGAVRLAVAVDRDGYNLYALGEPGSDRHGAMRQLLEEAAAQREVPSDWCYVHAFDDPQKPQALELPAGEGRRLRERMKQLIDDVWSSVPAAFESDEYRHLRSEIDEEFEERHRQALAEMAEDAERNGLRLLQTPGGFAFAPVRDGKVIDEEAFGELPEDEQGEIRRKITEFGERLAAHLRQLPAWQREHNERVRQLDRQVGVSAVGPFLEELKEGYRALENASAYLEGVEQDLLAHLPDLINPEPAAPFPPQSGRRQRPKFLQRYEVNVVVDNSGLDAAPVIYEQHPVYHNVVGRIDHYAEFGSLVTDHRMIRAGALQRAGGGFLVMDADRLLREPFAWQALKRALSGREVTIQSLQQMLSLMTTVTIEPEPIPMTAKIVLVGERWLYYLLSEHDPEFSELFRVSADFSDVIDRDGGHSEELAALIAGMLRRGGLAPFSRDAVARVVEHSARLAGDADKLSARIRPLGDLLAEACHWAREAGRRRVDEEDVERALTEYEHRHDRIRERYREAIARRSILVDVTGEAVAQVNGLSVLQLGKYAFGHPTRITATVRVGDGSLLDIQREVELGGPIHSKGVLILGSLLGARYSREAPLSLSASLVFEQTYGGVEGDSASVAEFCSLVSALAEVPVRQAVAVTGSVNQHGRVQVVGGINEKVEGFFDVCADAGLTGDQGVVIPADNRKHLMLRRDVREAVEARRFHVYAVDTVDEAIELLTGESAGVADRDGNYPAGTVNGRAQKTLSGFSEGRARFVARQLENVEKAANRNGNGNGSSDGDGE